MYCTSCGNKMSDGAKFCTKCGASLEDEMSIKESVLSDSVSQEISDYSSQQQSENQAYMSPSEYGKVFVEPDEQLLGTLGNGYIENILGKKVKKTHALLTNKRVYFQGTFFSGSGKKLQQDIIEKVVDLEDITGTGFRYNKPLGILATIITVIRGGIMGALVGYICGDICGQEVGISVGTIIGFSVIIYIVYYLSSREVDFILEYAGGAIRFNATIVGLSHVKDFQKQIRRAKDKAKGKI